jgi:hypothetical protein
LTDRDLLHFRSGPHRLHQAPVWVRLAILPDRRVSQICAAEPG